MKKHLLTALFVALAATAFADRPSTDELAIRLGVQSWFSARSWSNGKFNFAKLQSIYCPDLEFSEKSAGGTATKRGLSAYTAMMKPIVEQVQKLAAKPGDDVRVTLQGATATTTFSFQPQGTYKDGRAVTCSAHVTLTWERHNGLWQIAREETVPLGRVTISRPSTSPPGAPAAARRKPCRASRRCSR